jgi:hypothetical protein
LSKHTKITIETDTLLVLRGRRPLLAFCPACGVEAEMIPIEEAGIVSNLTASEVEAWMQAEDLHRTHAPDGALLLCLSSMVKRLQKTSGALPTDTSQP